MTTTDRPIAEKLSTMIEFPHDFMHCLEAEEAIKAEFRAICREEIAAKADGDAAGVDTFMREGLARAKDYPSQPDWDDAARPAAGLETTAEQRKLWLSPPDWSMASLARDFARLLAASQACVDALNDVYCNVPIEPHRIVHRKVNGALATMAELGIHPVESRGNQGKGEGCGC